MRISRTRRRHERRIDMLGTSEAPSNSLHSYPMLVILIRVAYFKAEPLLAQEVYKLGPKCLNLVALHFQTMNCYL